MEKTDKTIQEEGNIKIHLKLTSDEKYKNTKDVFYNPVQVFNRDLTLLVTYLHAKNTKKELEDKKKEFKGLRIYDALTATGLRALRFRKELPDNLIKKVIGCDLSEIAIKIFKKNLELNNLQNDDKIKTIIGDTNKYMCNLEEENKFDVIDLDPYGSMVPFLFPTINALNKNGLLCVNCTDSRVLFGRDYQKCFYQYRAVRGGNFNMEEIGIRIVLQSLSIWANMQNCNFKVLLSFQSEFYIRVYIKILKGKRNCWDSICQNGLYFSCIECCYQSFERFGRLKNNGKYKANSSFKLKSNRCPFCKKDLKMSFLKRWTIMVRPNLRSGIC